MPEVALTGHQLCWVVTATTPENLRSCSYGPVRQDKTSFDHLPCCCREHTWQRPKHLGEELRYSRVPRTKHARAASSLRRVNVRDQQCVDDSNRHSSRRVKCFFCCSCARANKGKRTVPQAYPVVLSGKVRARNQTASATFPCICVVLSRTSFQREMAPQRARMYSVHPMPPDLYASRTSLSVARAVSTSIVSLATTFHICMTKVAKFLVHSSVATRLVARAMQVGRKGTFLHMEGVDFLSWISCSIFLKQRPREKAPLFQ